MKIRNIKILALLIVVSVTSGCAAYRVDSNIKADSAQGLSSDAKVIISEGDITEQKYKVIGPIEVSVKKLTVFHDDPTKEQANAALREKARAIGANAVIKVTYESGVGLMTWGYMDAKGTGVNLAE
jgi:uncharacterized protein YbjQ (UPF0145 family)